MKIFQTFLEYVIKVIKWLAAESKPFFCCSPIFFKFLSIFSSLFAVAWFAIHLLHELFNFLSNFTLQASTRKDIQKQSHLTKYTHLIQNSKITRTLKWRRDGGDTVDAERMHVEVCCSVVLSMHNNGLPHCRFLFNFYFAASYSFPWAQKYVLCPFWLGWVPSAVNSMA